jgi:hypothetical protein
MLETRTDRVILATCLAASILMMGATCGPKKVCNTIQEWNIRSGMVLTTTWNVWSDFYLESNTVVVAEILEDHAPDLTPDVIDDLIPALTGDGAPENPKAKEIYEDYLGRMETFDKSGEKLERALDYSAESMEVLEHAMLACNGYSSQEIYKAAVETARSLLDVIDILTLAGVPVPKEVHDAREMAEKIADMISEFLDK